METQAVLVIGAGPAGLATAASLRRRGIEAVILDKASTVGSVWRRHYDRLHLHTHRRHSALPGLAMPATYGRYPSRAQFVDYLESYAARFDLKPVFDAAVHAVRREGARWRVEAGERSAAAAVVVVATGLADFPYAPTWPGMETFEGSVAHSSAYRNPAAYAGKRVLVVGFGNSGGEIALDLAEGGTDVTLAVRGPVCILPHDLLGLPIVTWAIAQSNLPAHVSDFINAPVIRLAVGSIEALGMTRAAKGPRRMVEEDGRVPLLDVGTVAKIRAGAIKVRGAIDRLTPEGVVFSRTGPEAFDAIILATGFRPDLSALLPDARGVLNADGQPLVSGRPTAEPGLFFCGAKTPATGQLREIGIEAERIAAAAAALVGKR
ncbi:MAG TPA: NAD(P)/FAD-dependent oxidoreductase [Roseiarcus sp.]|jgi:cation diffusion facilitator CzcD-associated flavoprotein CzcO